MTSISLSKHHTTPPRFPHWARLEAEEEACAEDGLTVVGTEDRFEDFVGL